MEEVWKTIKQSENYQISNLGNFRSKRKPLKCNINARGYKYCNISVKGKVSKIKIHILVALYFIDNPNNLETVNHKDGNKLNNHYKNLEWLTLKQNIQHYFKNK